MTKTVDYTVHVGLFKVVHWVEYFLWECFRLQLWIHTNPNMPPGDCMGAAFTSWLIAWEILWLNFYKSPVCQIIKLFIIFWWYEECIIIMWIYFMNRQNWIIGIMGIWMRAAHSFPVLLSACCKHASWCGIVTSLSQPGLKSYPVVLSFSPWFWSHAFKLLCPALCNSQDSLIFSLLAQSRR